MRRMKLSALALIGVLGVSSVTDVARAGCCDDFWSCAAAVATAGASCQIQNLIESVTALKNAVDTTIANMSTQASSVIAQAQKGVGDAAGELKQVRAETAAQLKASTDQAHELANPARPVTAVGLKPGVLNKPVAGSGAAMASKPLSPGLAKAVNAGSTASPPKPADPQATKDALTRGDKYAQELLAKSTAPANLANQMADAAIAATARHLDAARRISLDLALTPLNMVRDSLLDLLKHPERLFDPSAQINADIQRIATQMPAMFDRITTEVTQEALAQLNQGSAAVQQLQESASSANTVAEAMQKLQDSKLQSDLDALNGLLPKQAVAVAPAAGGVARAPMVALSPSVTLANKQRLTLVLNRADTAKLPVVVQQKAVASDLSSRWQAIQLKQKTAVAIDVPTQQKVDKDLNQMFVGKKGADVAKKKQELMAEAKKRFGNDPKTLAKVQQYIETHAPKG